MKRIGLAVVATTAGVACWVWVAAIAAQGTQPVVASEVTLSDIPGITTPDKTPRACVDCHANRPESNMDFRLPSILAKWREGADPKILEKARAAAPRGKTLVGKHPDVSEQIRTIPNDCLQCHMRDSRDAPPFTKLLHAIHLVGGKENGFLTVSQGTCTNCHKLDKKTGAWHLGSGEAK